MRKYLSIFCLTLLFVANIKVNAADISISEALSQKKPTLVLITASWANSSSTAINNFNSLKKVHGDKCNFIILDIASKQAQVYNQTFAFLPRIPYVMMFKNKTKIQMYVEQSCILDNACILKKTSTFLH